MLAKLTMGSKNKEVDVASLPHADKPESSNCANNSKKKEVAVNLGPKFYAIVIDK